MTRIVVGLFESRSLAEDARNRLKVEGIPTSDMALRVLNPTGAIPSTMEPELDALSVDPLVFGNVRETFAKFIRNGETVVIVLAPTDEEVELAAYVLRLYAPVALDTMPL
ncbi:MAG: SPOR domain-containing protein [Alphaproteobacteria bacterium]|nr:SPOR domain-containing protein [Alphaproteobacteria bacterium]